MADFLTPEEEYELMYGEELEMMNDFEEPENVAAPIASTQKTTVRNDNTLLSSPALSQISRDERHIPFTPSNNIHKNKKTSTPFLEKLKAVDDEFDKIKSKNIDALNEIQNFGMKRKRKLEDLFGDIYDIEAEDAFFKKPKTEEEKDMETIEKIIEARKVFDLYLNPLKNSEFDRLEALHKFKKDNISKTIPRYPFMTLSSLDDRYYVRFHSEDFENKKLTEIEAHNLNAGKFFGNQTEQLWQEANQIILKNVQGSSQMRQLAQENSANHQNTSGASLWVEKYCPKKYIDLLSDESTNRSLLQWIKLWDKAVFNREPVKKNTKPGELSNFNRRTGRFEQNGGWIKRKFRGNMLNTELDENGVPVQKIALLVGRPGLGKTTLAHVIAKHAGYEVREMNASDDRNVDSFRQILESCTQMKSVLNRENRPNCIVLDEIDGAPLPSVEFLIRFVSGQISEKSKKGKNNKKFVLKRPIICICNDLYGANLRTLRQIAFVVNFQSIDNARLAERLIHISYREHVKTDMTAMLSLAEKTGGDIRSCISVIQFFSNTKKALTLFDVLKSNVGQKDQHKTLFNVWSSIFQIQRPKKVLKQSSNDQQKQIIGMTDMSIRTRMMYVLEMVNSCGEYEKLGQGVFENFLKQKIQDTNLTSIVEASKWFCFNDLIQHKINTQQNYIIYPYLQFAFVCWHFCFSSMAYPQITYPQKQYEVSQKISTSKQIFECIKKGIVSNGVRAGHELLIDTISLLKNIICPEIRSVSMHLLTPNEKIDLHHTVQIYADFGVSLIQMQAADGTYLYRSEPDIDHFSFTGIPNKQISYWSKQIIAQEVQVEKMRRARPKVGIENLKIIEEKTKKAEKAKEILSPTSENKALPNHLQRLMPIIAKEKLLPSTLVCKDFFGRAMSKESTSDNSSVHGKF
ncbi:hypothetical protein ACKWTF_001745 [Chironomus riparius]